jgi:hypothetical protein
MIQHPQTSGGKEHNRDDKEFLRQYTVISGNGIF